MRTMLPALLCVIALLCAALAQDKQPAEPEKAADAEAKALATQAYFVLRENCWSCHGEPGKKAYGETVPLDWILDHDQLLKTKTVVPGSAKESRLIYIIAVEGKMPRAFDENGRPGIEAEMPEADLQTLIDWVKAGAPKWPEPEYSHEWARVAAMPQDARLVDSHLGLLAVPDGDPIQQFKDGKWHNLEHAVDGSLLEASTATDATWLLLQTKDKYALQRLDAKGLSVLKLPDWKAPRRVMLLPGSTGLVAAVEGDGGRELLQHWSFADGQWTMAAEFREPDQWVPLRFARNDQGGLLTLGARRTAAGFAMLQLVDGGWETLARVGGMGTPGPAALGPDGNALVKIGDALYQFQPDQAKWQPLEVARNAGQFTWQASERAWYQAGTALQKLIPWREAAAKKD